MAKKLKSIWDESLQEDVAWRLENLNDWLDLAAWPADSSDVFERRAWTSPRDDWDHDHCEGCWAKFKKDGVDDTLSHGWVLISGSHLGQVEEWICDPCYLLLCAARSGTLELVWLER